MPEPQPRTPLPGPAPISRFTQPGGLRTAGGNGSHPTSIRPVVVCSLLTALAALSISSARAAFPLVVDDAGVHPPGKFELDVAVNAMRTPAADTLDTNIFLVAGLCPKLEGALVFGYGWRRDRLLANAPISDGPLDLTVGLKSPILAGDSVPFAFTLSATAKLPTASAHLGLGTGSTDLSLLAIVTRSWGALSLDLNGGFTWTVLGRRTDDALFTGAALRWQAGKRLLIFTEAFATLPTDGGGDPTGTVRAGWQIKLRPAVLLAGAIGRGCGSGSAEVMGTIGMTINF